MPLLNNNDDRPPFIFRSGHVQTIYPALFRRLPLPPFRKERITTEDHDFLDLYWLQQTAGDPSSGGHCAQQPLLAILTHGLEGNAFQPYMLGMARALFASGYDVLAWNLRGCGDQPNLQLRSYHSGASDDLAAVIAHACRTQAQPRIALVGFSLGGNIVLKYLGEQAAAPHLVGAVAISVPCDLAGSTAMLERRSNRIYMERFLKTLRRKILEKHQRFPDRLTISGLRNIRTFREFDDRYTAPLHGFTDAEHYWHACSCLRVIDRIAVPTLLLNATDDPFLSPDCFPSDIAAAHPFLHLQMPRYGGHVGFVRHAHDGLYHSELRACEFLANCAAGCFSAAPQVPFASA